MPRKIKLNKWLILWILIAFYLLTCVVFFNSASIYKYDYSGNSFLSLATIPTYMIGMLLCLPAVLVSIFVPDIPLHYYQVLSHASGIIVTSIIMSFLLWLYRRLH